jgi:hypothetical protein
MARKRRLPYQEKQRRNSQSCGCSGHRLSHLQLRISAENGMRLADDLEVKTASSGVTSTCADRT